MSTKPFQKAVNLFLAVLLLALALFPLPAANVAAALPVQQEGEEASSSGLDPSGAVHVDLQESAELMADPTILCFHTQTGNNSSCTRLSSIFSTVTTVTNLDQFPANLAPYKVVYVGYSNAGTLSSKASQIQSYVNSGGGLIVEQPNTTGPVAILPAGFEVNVTSIHYSTTSRSYTFAGIFHPITIGLNNEHSSGNFETIPTSSLGSSWMMLLKASGYPHAALLTGAHGSGRIVLHTGNIATASIIPGSNTYITRMINWAGKVTVTPGPDMRITRMEVTQAIQDLNNSVDLIANKRTYVRVHVSSPTSVAAVTANLSGKRGTTTLTPVLTPGNPGGQITVKTSPDRGQINDSFWFELPASWTASGNLTLTATLDPSNTKNDPVYSNNVSSVTVNFKSTPALRLRLYNVRYKVGSTFYQASNFHLNMVESWLRRAYPISNLSVSRFTYHYPFSGLPGVDSLNVQLAGIRLWDIIFKGVSSKAVYYGLVDDGGGFMRGKALGIPGHVASGPTGPTTSRFTWDTDGSYGDWYTGHEIAHTRNRKHAEFCGATGGASYPYSNGRISPTTTGNTAIYGFDITTRAIYPPTWTDVMTYCTNQWISDFTYEGIRSYLASVGMMENRPMLQAEQVLFVTGLANLDEGTAEIHELAKIDMAMGVEEPIPGEWTIVQLSAANAVLSSIPFTPYELTDDEEDPARMGIISELVPLQQGTVKVQIRYRDAVVAERSASPSAPSVVVTDPKEGSEFRSTFDVSWQGSDPDGDPLTYTVLFSGDGGETWDVAASGLEEESITLDAAELPGGEAKIKIIANDGFNTGEADSPWFYVFPHPPQVLITSPAEGEIFYPAQNITLAGSAMDIEDGAIEDDMAFSWSSNLDGDLGKGMVLNTAELSEGEHTITLNVVDSDGQTGSAFRLVKVVPAETPLPIILEVAPFSVGTVKYVGTPDETQPLTVRTSSGDPAAWTVSGSAPWLSLSAASGTSDSDLTLTFSSAGLAPGVYETMLTFSAPGTVNGTVVVPVTMQVIPLMDLYLPLLSK